MKAALTSVAPTVYSLFLRGLDTVEISKRLRIPEHEVVHKLTIERSRAKGVETDFEPSPYSDSPMTVWRDGGNPHLGPLP